MRNPFKTALHRGDKLTFEEEGCSAGCEDRP